MKLNLNCRTPSYFHVYVSEIIRYVIAVKRNGWRIGVYLAMELLAFPRVSLITQCKIAKIACSILSLELLSAPSNVRLLRDYRFLIVALVYREDISHTVVRCLVLIVYAKYLSQSRNLILSRFYSVLIVPVYILSVPALQSCRNYYITNVNRAVT